MQDEIISKTRRKRQMHALQDIGEKLVALNPGQLEELALPEVLLEAVMEAKRLRTFEARRRQMQYIGKLMRKIDAAPIEEKLKNRYTFATMNAQNTLVIGLVSISDRASSGVYQDQGIPSLKEWFTQALATPWRMETRLIPDERGLIEKTLIELVDEQGCHLVLTTGGTGPAPRDVTPEATLAVADKELPGFGEQMRAVSLKYVPTAILSRQAGVIRKHSLILNLPGQPKAIKETLDGVFPAVPYCIDLIGGPYIETNEAVVKAFRPKSAQRPKN